MPFLVYAAILIATVFSVALEWDALVQPSAATRHAMQALTKVNSPPPARAVIPAAAVPDQSASASPAPVADQPSVATPDQPVTADQPAVSCDVTACAVAYRSFRASDCSWQPNEGPRRLCTKGAAADADTARAESAVANCHIRACAEHYSSFNPSDCTYQPLDGPRRLCEK